MVRYQDWTGERKQKCKRGFATKREAQEWERSFQMQTSGDLDMTFEAFTELYTKDVLAKKGATYQNVYFDSDGEAGKFTANIFAYPTTYVIDRNGNIVGEPIVGAITEKNQAETLQSLIDQAIAADAG